MEIVFVNVKPMEHGLEISSNVKVWYVDIFTLKWDSFIRWIEIRCPPLKVNSQIIQECSPKNNNTNFKVGTKCQAKCKETGFKILGPLIRECLIIGIWSGYEQICIGKKTHN